MTASSAALTGLVLYTTCQPSILWWIDIHPAVNRLLCIYLALRLTCMRVKFCFLTQENADEAWQQEAFSERSFASNANASSPTCMWDSDRSGPRLSVAQSFSLPTLVAK